MTSPSDSPELVEKVKQAIRKAFVEHWKDAVNAREWEQDILMTGCRAAKYENPETAATSLANDAARAAITTLLGELMKQADKAVGEHVANFIRARLQEERK